MVRRRRWVSTILRCVRILSSVLRRRWDRRTVHLLRLLAIVLIWLSNLIVRILWDMDMLSLILLDEILIEVTVHVIVTVTVAVVKIND